MISSGPILDVFQDGGIIAGLVGMIVLLAVLRIMLFPGRRDERDVFHGMIFGKEIERPDAASSNSSESPRIFRFHPSRALQADCAEMERLQRDGLNYFKVFFGPASGPRSFVTVGFDKHVMEMVANGEIVERKWIVSEQGASTSALRFMALLSSLATGRDVSNELKEHYCQMIYRKGDTPQVLRPMMEECYRIVAPPDAIDAALGHPHLKIAILVGDINRPYRNLPDWKFKCVLAAYAVANAVNTDLLAGLVSRVCFYSGDVEPRFLENGLGGRGAIRFVRLTRENVFAVLHATTCIPFIQKKYVRN
ncbi:hypothetical protein HK101_008028 [Irineochytrium annulatum]|nr:hypothetical protein HK101_008028 [Irineochytrium annulatum]